jgi:capsular exopolysaccharide synthesis family protein
MEVQQFLYVVLLAILGAAAVGFAGALLRTTSSDLVSSYDRVRRATRLPKLGKISAFSTGGSTPFIALERPQLPEAEDLYHVATRLQSASTGQGKVIVITSPAHGDGKTTLAANLAVALAVSGTSVVAVDTDYAHARLHQLFSLANIRGVFDILRDSTVTSDSCLQSAGIEGLQLLTAGAYDLDAPYLLGSETMGQLLDHLRRQTEIVLVDAPALTESMEVRSLAGYADDTILVVDATRTTRQGLSEAEGLLRSNNSVATGVLLNKAYA